MIKSFIVIWQKSELCYTALKYNLTTEKNVMKTVMLCLSIAVLCLVSLFYVGQTQALEEFIHVDIEPYSIILAP